MQKLSDVLNLKHYLGYDRLLVGMTDIKREEELIRGTLLLESKTGAHLEYLFLRIIESYGYGWWKNKKETELVLGDRLYDKNMSLEKNKKYSLKFSIPFAQQRSKIEQQEQEGPILHRWLARAAKKLGNAQSSYQIVAEIKLIGSPVKSYFKKQIEL